MSFLGPSFWKEISSKIVDIIFRSTSFVIVLFFVSGTLLFLDGIIEKLSLIGLRNQYKPLIGLVFLISICLIITDLLLFFYKRISNLLTKRAGKKHLLAYLHELTPMQKEALRNYTKMNTRTIAFPMDHGAARELEGEGILYETTGHFNEIGHMSFTITDWIWEILKDHPEILS